MDTIPLKTITMPAPVRQLPYRTMRKNYDCTCGGGIIAVGYEGTQLMCMGCFAIDPGPTQALALAAHWLQEHAQVGTFAGIKFGETPPDYWPPIANVQRMFDVRIEPLRPEGAPPMRSSFPRIYIVQHDDDTWSLEDPAQFTRCPADYCWHFLTTQPDGTRSCGYHGPVLP
nr:hypothetical protein [Ktedonobacterales bacterium]